MVFVSHYKYLERLRFSRKKNQFCYNVKIIANLQNRQL